MRRRAIIQTFFGAFASVPFIRRLRASSTTDDFPGAHEDTLKELAATVLPENLKRQGTDRVSTDFVRWVRKYEPGAEMQSGYGVTRVRVEPPSPAAKYLHQLNELSRSVFLNSDLGGRRKQLATMLNAANVGDLPPLPQSGDIVVDLMTFYFTSSQANDLAYEAAIERDRCRSLDNSGQIPPPLKGAKG